MSIIQVKGNTYCIDMEESYIPFYKINETDIILIDSGYVDYGSALESIIEENKFNLKGIITSHCHPDHVGNHQYLKNKYNCIIAAPSFEAQICKSAINFKAYYNSITHTEIEDKYSFIIFETDVYINDNEEEIDFCGVNFKLVHTPGHSPSHICIITPDNVAYLADSLISYEIIETAKIPFHFVLLEDMKSKDKLLSLDCDSYIVAHKGIYSDITNLTADNIAFYVHRAKKIYELINNKMTMDEIVKAASKSFNIKLNNIYKYDLISRMLTCYVDYLQEAGKIKLVLENGYRKYERII